MVVIRRRRGMTIPLTTTIFDVITTKDNYYDNDNRYINGFDGDDDEESQGTSVNIRW